MAQTEFAHNDVSKAPFLMHPQHELADEVSALPAVVYEDEADFDGEAEWGRSLDLTGTTPTFLPDVLRAVAKWAGQLAGDPLNALDNNPFIVREWLIVSQVLHAAAGSMEKRFEALFLGL